MAKFCTKCGKPLKDGKPCDCEKENKKVVDSLTAVCYSEKCYIMARYACLSKSTNGIML